MPISETEAKAALPMLEKVPMLFSLKKPQLKKIVEASTIRSFDSGQVIAKQGDAGVAFYLVLEGQVEVKRGKRTLAKLRNGQFFGELSVFDEGPRTADVVALEKSKCLLLTTWTFHGLIKSNPDIAIVMLKEMARRLRETDQSLGD